MKQWLVFGSILLCACSGQVAESFSPPVGSIVISDTEITRPELSPSGHSILAVTLDLSDPEIVVLQEGGSRLILDGHDAAWLTSGNILLGTYGSAVLLEVDPSGVEVGRVNAPDGMWLGGILEVEQTENRWVAAQLAQEGTVGAGALWILDRQTDVWQRARVSGGPLADFTFVGPNSVVLRKGPSNWIIDLSGPVLQEREVMAGDVAFRRDLSSSGCYIVYKEWNLGGDAVLYIEDWCVGERWPAASDPELSWLRLSMEGTYFVGTKVSEGIVVIPFGDVSGSDHLLDLENPDRLWPFHGAES